MGLNDTPAAMRVHIGFFGRRNAGKSSLINAFTGQTVSIVSDTPGTTADPVTKAMELLPLGPVSLIDTAGVDDEGDIGALRVERTLAVLDRVDAAVVVADAADGLGQWEQRLLELLSARHVPYLLAMNKADCLPERPPLGGDALYTSARTLEGVEELKTRLSQLTVERPAGEAYISDLIGAGDTVLLITPIDQAAPKGRMILPQQMALRDILDADGMALTVKEDRIGQALAMLQTPPRLAITDSQAFRQAAAAVDPAIPLTSFSILMARYKGTLDGALEGIAALRRLRDGDTILISEGCTHRRQCGDIGTVKLPQRVREKTGRTLNVAFTSGGAFPDDLTPYALIIHCGGCMLKERELMLRAARAKRAGVPMTNYGLVLAWCTGVLDRALEPLELTL